jgi:nitrate/nitrite transporter NarK
MLSFSDFGAFFSPTFGGFLYSRHGIGSIMVACLLVLTATFVSSTFLVETSTRETFDPEQSSQRSSEADPLLSKPASRHDYILPARNNKIFELVPILRCFCKPSFSVAILLCVLYGAQLAAFDATVPIEARYLFSFEPLNSGVLFLPIAIARLIVGPLGGYLVDKYNPRLIAISGYLFLIPVYISFRFIEPEPRQLQIGLYSLLLSLGGVGTALVASTSIVESSTLVGKYHSANPHLFGDEAPIGSLNGIYLAGFGIGASLGAIGAGSLRNR